MRYSTTGRKMRDQMVISTVPCSTQLLRNVYRKKGVDIRTLACIAQGWRTLCTWLAKAGWWSLELKPVRSSSSLRQKVWRTCSSKESWWMQRAGRRRTVQARDGDWPWLYVGVVISSYLIHWQRRLLTVKCRVNTERVGDLVWHVDNHRGQCLSAWVVQGISIVLDHVLAMSDARSAMVLYLFNNCALRIQGHDF